MGAPDQRHDREGGHPCRPREDSQILVVDGRLCGHDDWTEAEDLLLGFPRALRDAGLAIDPARAANFLAAVRSVPLHGTADLARAGRVTLTSSPAEFPLFDAVFKVWFASDPMLAVEPPEGGEQEAPKPRPKSDPQNLPDFLPSEATGKDATIDEVIGTKTFARSRTDDDQILASIRATERPRIVSRRWRPAPRGPRIDLARTAAEARRTLGETIRLARKARPKAPRKLLLLIDISGSMKAYSESYLRAAHALQGGNGRMDVFCFGTRLSRITPSLRHRDQDVALKKLAHLVFDFDGGTRIGGSLETFLGASRNAALVRGAVTMVWSDGLERGDIAPMVRAVDRLARLSHRLVWLTPLAADPRRTRTSSRTSSPSSATMGR